MKKKNKHTSRPGTTFKDKDARIIGAYLDKMFPGGVYTPKEVVEVARPRQSPIHKYFEWNDTRAAELYRLQQARKLISCLFVEVNGVENVPKAVSVYVGTSNTRSYVNTDVASGNSAIWDQVLEDALNGLRSWKLRFERFEEVKELRPIFKAITEVHKKYENKKTSSKKGRVKGSSNSAHQQEAGKNYNQRNHSASRQSL